MVNTLATAPITIEPKTGRFFLTAMETWTKGEIDLEGLIAGEVDELDTCITTGFVNEGA